MNKVIIGSLLMACTGLAQAQEYNTQEGYDAFAFNISGDYNSAYGAYALYSNSIGKFNTAVGASALQNNDYGSANTVSGYQALFNNVGGNFNIAIGYLAGYTPRSGNYNILIGHSGLVNDTGVIRIGTQGTQRFTQIAGIYESKVVGGRAVVVDSKGHLGYASTTVVPNTVATVSTADILSLRTEIASLRNELNALKSKVH